MSTDERKAIADVPPTEPKMLLACDFDRTLWGKHFHDMANTSKAEGGYGLNYYPPAPEDVQRKVFDELRNNPPYAGLRFENEMLDLWQNVLENGGAVCIVSSSRFPNFINWTLEIMREKLKARGLSDDQLKRIYYEAPDLRTAPPTLKIKELDGGMRLAGLKPGQYNRVLSLDDDWHALQDLRAATGERLNIVHAPAAETEEGRRPTHFKVAQATASLKPHMNVRWRIYPEENR